MGKFEEGQETFPGRDLGPFLPIRGPQGVLWGT